MNLQTSLKIQRYCYRELNKWGGENIAFFLKVINRILYATDISYKADIADDCDFPHKGLGVVIGDKCVIGKGCIIRQNVTIGGKNRGNGYECPVIGNNCMIGAGAVVLGGIKIGNNVQIGANAVVVNDIPSNAIAVGVPAKVINILNAEI